jgi:hypothetical protein
MNLKKLIIFPVIIFLIVLTAGSILVENMKYSGLTEEQIQQTKMIVKACTGNGGTDCERYEEMTIWNFRQVNP